MFRIRIHFIRIPIQLEIPTGIWFEWGSGSGSRLLHYKTIGHKTVKKFNNFFTVLGSTGTGWDVRPLYLKKHKQFRRFVIYKNLPSGSRTKREIDSFPELKHYSSRGVRETPHGHKKKVTKSWAAALFLSDVRREEEPGGSAGGAGAEEARHWAFLHPVHRYLPRVCGRTLRGQQIPNLWSPSYRCRPFDLTWTAKCSGTEVEVTLLGGAGTCEVQ